MSRRKRFGEILIDAGVLDEDSLQKALAAQKGSGKRLGRILEELGVIKEKDIAVVLGRQFGFKTVSGLARHEFPRELLDLIDGSTVLSKLVFPLRMEGRTLFLAMVNPLDMETIDNLSFRLAIKVVPCVTTPTEIQEAAARHYSTQDDADDSDWWRVLVVEDQELALAASLAALRRQGYTALQAANGAEGLKVAIQKAPHLIVTDMVMPRMDGYELFRSLQSNVKTRVIPVIAMSSKGSPDEEARVLEMGYFDFIAKPINPVRLVARCKRALHFVHGETPPQAGAEVAER